MYSAHMVVTKYLQEVLFESKIYNAAHSVIYLYEGWHFYHIGYAQC